MAQPQFCTPRCKIIEGNETLMRLWLANIQGVRDKTMNDKLIGCDILVHFQFKENCCLLDLKKGK